MTELTILSKIQLNQSSKVDSKKFENINLYKEKDLNLILVNLKTTYENYWKNINQINTSIKLPLTISINATQHKKIQILENSLNELDLVSNFEILKLNNKIFTLRLFIMDHPISLLVKLK